MGKITFLKSPGSRNLRPWYFALLAICALLPYTSAMAQTGTIGIGIGEAVNNTVLPINSCYGYNYTQQIVKASEYAAGGGVAGQITSLRFYYGTGGPNFANWDHWVVYLGQTEKTSFASNTDWEPVESLTQVFDGTITPSENGWMEITFDVPVAYNGTSNLIVAVHEDVPGWSCTANFGSYTSDANTGIYYYNDGTNPDPAAPPAANARTASLARLQFDGAVASCLAPTALVTEATGTTTGLLSWTASESNAALGYDYYYNTTGTAPTASTVPNGTVGAGVLGANLTGLTQNSNYTIWVRSRCSATDISSWSLSTTLTTFCDPTNLPYIQNFESATPPAIPDCTFIENAGEGNNWYTSAAPGSGFNSKVLRYSYNGANDANAWFFTRGVNLTAGQSYRVTYKYGNDSTFYTESLQVAFGTSPSAADMTNLLATHDEITGAIPTLTFVDFTAPTTGVYFIGFNAYSIADQNQLYVDDISVRTTPTCFTPTAVVAGPSTETSVSFSWTASSPQVPALGYEYYYSLTNTAPEDATAASGNVGAGVTTATITGLPSSTTYYVWVRGNCSATDKSEWTLLGVKVATLCDAPEITSTTPGSVCGQGSVALQAASTGTLNWYAAATGGAILGTGATFNSPSINTTTTFYVEASNPSTEFIGAEYTGTATNGINVGSHGVVITTTRPNVVINSADIPFTGSGTITLALKDINSGTLITTSTSESVDGGGTTATTVPFNLTIENAGTYQLVVNAVTGDVNNLGYATAEYPFTSGDGSVSIDSGYWYGATASNMYLFNFNVTSSCASIRQAVVATVTNAVAITAQSSAPAICAGGSANLSVTSANAAYTYMWMPGSLSGATQTVSPAATTTYTVTATDAGTNCVTSQTVTVIVNVLPTALNLADNIALCEGGAAVALTPAGGSTLNTILTQDFNGATNNWTAVNNSTGGTVANAAWTLRADGYVYGGTTFHSNDNSQFYMSNSDAQGFGSTTSTILTSPAFSTMDYQSADIKFFHYFYEPFSPSTGNVEVSLNGTDWVVLQSYTATTGASNGFTEATVALTAPYLNKPTVYVRFKFDGSYRYYWAIDNVSLTGQQSGSIVWTPQAGLFTDAAATMAYTGQAATTVYAKPMANAVYTATVTNPASCSVSESVNVNITVTAAPTAAASQTFCNSGTVAGLVATGETGAAINWYSAATGGNALSAATALTNGGVYYASQTPTASCESAARTMVTATINTVAAPVAAASQTFCNAGTVANLNAVGGAGATVTWYTAATGGTVVTQETALINGGVYYAAAISGSCESTARTMVTATVNTVAAPQAPTTQFFCNSATVENLTATGGAGSVVIWYDAATGGTALQNSVALNNEGVYYASATADTCESTGRTMVTVQISTAAMPTGESVQTISLQSGESATTADIVLTSEGTATWYASQADAINNTNPIGADVALVSGNTYYATQTEGACISAPFAVTVNTVLGIKGFDAASFSYHPNPVKDVLNISYTSDITSVAVFNMLGQQVMVKGINAAEGKVDMSALADGTYIVNVTAGNIVKTIKVVKKQ